ncbi:hypothetical protein BKA66DRAFT_475470 [Pyrenochaeta sp. MPI-SDFR-AT-0127]|nr:hypothetical protein BKA66DRAFT_475470 [Pyrenochaeta sp. MPI-SDFR-AT-0127]
MTKDWDVVQEEIKELSFNQKKPLDEVRALMERKYKFRASTRAYRMKLKEWGLMRHKARKARKDRTEAMEEVQPSCEEGVQNRDSSATVEPMSIEATPVADCDTLGGWQVVANADAEAEPTFLGLLGRSGNLQPSFDPLSQARSRASEIVLDMLSAILDQDSQKLESLIVEHINHINDPIGLPFGRPNSRFFGHPALSEMVIFQHPDQTLLDVACGMPCGPIIWVLLSHGAKGSKHPLGTDLALHNAIKNGRLYTVQALLVPGRSQVNGVSGTTWKPLQQAAFWNVPDVVRILLNRGANIDDPGSSTIGIGALTALQLCLEHRLVRYADDPVKERCHEILKMLLDAGADVHVASVEGTTQSPFEVFIKPWQRMSHLPTGLSQIELDCFRAFVSKGAKLQVQFEGYPCRSPWSKTLEHQVLWHSTPSFARLLVDSVVVGPHNNGSSLLHEVLGSCPDAERHPVYTLRDIEVLLQKGVDPNLTDVNGLSPLKRCIELCPAVDLVARLKVLLDRGADPEVEDDCGVPPYVSAARTFDEPLLSEVMQVLVSKMRGRSARLVDGVSHTWTENHFPISEDQTYEQVMSATRSTGEFMLNMKRMVPEDVQQTFQRAYFAVVSSNFLDAMTKVAKSKMLSAKEKDEIRWIISMRKGVDLPIYKFDQELVMALLDPQPVPLETLADTTMTSNPPHEPAATVSLPPAPNLTVTPSSTSSPAHEPFQFNPNGATAQEEHSVSSRSSERSNANADDFFVPSTTSIRWQDPCILTKPIDVNKALAAAVLIDKCEACDDGTLLTKKELEKHKVEHAHSVSCIDGTCMRRFCTGRRKKENSLGCQDHLFVGVM